SKDAPSIPKKQYTAEKKLPGAGSVGGGTLLVQTGGTFFVISDNCPTGKMEWICFSKTSRSYYSDSRLSTIRGLF
ncbi:MAG TPA: hypothetical protein PK198_10435, partial [Saprospiraceae bacterium]|nr:hypothetical protein [Saprospiraceae bacterium]